MISFVLFAEAAKVFSMNEIEWVNGLKKKDNIYQSLKLKLMINQ